MTTVQDVRAFYGLIRAYTYQKNYKDAPGLKQLAILVAISTTVSTGILGAALLHQELV